MGFSDRLKKPLTVKPEGIPVEKVESEFKCLESSTEKLTLSKLELPETVIEGSDRAWVHISGDILAPALQNIGNLVNMPTGNSNAIQGYKVNKSFFSLTGKVK